ncbi:hypothetical protein LguiA_009986 [Lonicera macranthoides]
MKTLIPESNHQLLQPLMPNQITNLVMEHNQPLQPPRPISHLCVSTRHLATSGWFP